MSVIFSAQLTAVATTVLAVFAIITAWYARRAYRAQAVQVGDLLKESKRQARERHRAQAARVFTGIQSRPGPLDHPYAQNASDFPVFDAVFWYTGPGGLDGPDELGQLGTILPRRAYDGHQMSGADALAHTILTFRDAEGTCWVRMPDGTFSEQSRPTARESVLAVLGETPPAAVRPPMTARPGGHSGPGPRP